MRLQAHECGSPLPLWNYSTAYNDTKRCDCSACLPIPKRQRTGALHDAPALSGACEPRASVVECGSPLPLSIVVAPSIITKRHDHRRLIPKRQRTGALQDAPALSGACELRASVVESSSPLPLSIVIAPSITIKRYDHPLPPYLNVPVSIFLPKIFLPMKTERHAVRRPLNLHRRQTVRF
jgi:hypothetical protein